VPTVRTRLLASAAVTVLFALTGCSGDDSAAPAAQPTGTSLAAPTSAAANPATTAASSVPPAATAVDKEIVVTVVGKKVTPPTGRVEVRKGAAVRITVTSDVADDLHVHGYDLKKALPAAQPASLDFRADQAGLFEVETHDTHLVLFQLVVR
jgi:FtsP/CotA-like multicopper oxidase with cupredoxin domain